MNEKYIIYSNKYSFRVRKSKLNGTVYDICFRVYDKDGCQTQKKLCGFKSKTEAKESYNQFIQEHCIFSAERLGKDVNRNAKDKQLQIYIDEYLRSLANKNKSSTAYDKANVFRLFVTPQIGAMKPSELTREALFSWQEWLWQRTNPRTGDFYSYRYLIKTRAHLSSFLNWMESKYGFANHLREIAVPRSIGVKKEMQFWTVEEFGKFISTVTDKTYHAFFVFAFYTGRRKGELFALSPEDINEQTIRWNKSLTRKTTKGNWEITSTKSGKSQILPYCPIIKDELSNYKPDGKFVFGGDKPLGENSVRMYFNKKCREAGVKQIRIHDLRHSFVSMLIHSGVNLTVVADLIGDTLEQVTKTYAHMYTDDRAKALAMLPKCF